MSKNYDVVISGISGTFPECKNLQELEENIFSDVNLVNDNNTKWRATDVSRHLGLMKVPNKFDDTFFGIHSKLASVLDPHAKETFEQTFEAICDSGRNPADFYGSNTAVIMASCINETEGENTLTTRLIGHLIIGYSRCMQSNRASYAFNFKGPSLTLVGSWDGAMQALALAQNLIQKGHIKSAIVGASNLIMYPQMSRHFQGLGKLNQDGKTKSFSATADGYSRSDGIVTFFLQRAEDAYRSYGSIVKVMSRAEMANRKGLTDPYDFSKFLGDFYSDVPVDPNEIAFVEGDGSASLDIDAEELDGLSQVLCPRRTKPLLVSCVKSKLGHCEGASAFVSIVNALIAMKTGYIPPVLHYDQPNPLVPALKDGRIKIVTEKTPVEGDYAGVTSIGLVSSFGHALLKRNPITRPLTKSDYFPEDGVPRIFLLSGRDEDTMKEVLTKVGESPIDDGVYWLNHTLFKQEFPKHLYRGYSIKQKDKALCQVTPYPGGAKRPVWFIFSGMGSQWPEMGRGIMQVPLMRKSIERSHKILESKGLDLISIINNPDPKTYNNILNCFVGIAAIQIALVDMLEALGIKCDGMVGHSVGELGCSYADKGLTAEQMILAAWARGTASNEAKLCQGMMAAVGRGYKDIKDSIPEGIEVACHNSDTSCTLSGPADQVDAYVKKLQEQGVFARLVNVANIAYHSKHIAPAGPLLLKYLKQIIPEPKKRSSKWISSSVPESKWNSELALHCSAEYHTNNLLSYVLFEEATKHVPKDAICIEIAPHGLLQAIVKKSLAKCTHIALTQRSKLECSFTMEALARLFCNGVEIDLTKLYPPVDLPLPRETNYIHHIFAWNHSIDWIPLSLERDFENIKGKLINKEIELANHPDEIYYYSLSHRINGKAVYPTSNLLCKVIEYVVDTFRDLVTFKKYHFQDLKFNQHLTMDKKSNEKLNILYQMGSGKFETIYDQTILAVGALNPLTTSSNLVYSDHLLQLTQNKSGVLLHQSDIYKFFEDKDCVFTDEFRNIIDVRITDKAFIGRVQWQGTFEYFIDAILKLKVLYDSINNDTLMEIDTISEFIFDPSLLPEDAAEISVYYDALLEQITADGVRITSLKTRRATAENVVNAALKKQIFAPLSKIQTQKEFIDQCLQIVHELACHEKINIVAKENSKILEHLIHSQYYESLLKTKGSISVANYKDLSQFSEDTQGSFLFVSDEKLPDSLVKMINSSNNSCYLIQSLPDYDTKSFTKFKQLTPILERTYEDMKIVFYKKSINVMTDSNFIQVPQGYILEYKSDTKEEFLECKKVTFLLFTYKHLSEIPILLEANKKYLEMKCMRFVFTDTISPCFDPTLNFYLLHLKKDLKINVCQNNVWGSLKSISMAVPCEAITESQRPLNETRCNGTDLKALGINLLNTLTPTVKDKVGLVDYCGVKGRSQDEVMGVGKLSSDNYLQVDPIFFWKKPKQWSHIQAATVPVVYAMAYYLLRIKTKPDQIKSHRVFVHGGHTALSQAVIKVAFDMKASVFTTCFTREQKKSILKRFPQLDETKVFLLKDGSKHLGDEIMMSTEGAGLTIVVDCMVEDDFRNITIQSCGKNGKYFLVCHNETDNNFTFGMSIFMRETSVMGFNPELMLDIPLEDKKTLVKLVEEGIQKGLVTPMDSITLEGSKPKKDAIETIVTSNQSQIESKKVVVSIEKHVPTNLEHSGISNGHSNGISSEHPENKNYMIIGSYNSIWYDLLNWLAIRGAVNVFIIMDWNSAPTHIQIRYKSFTKRHSHINVKFLGLEHLKTAESFQNILQKIGQHLDETYYIAPGLDDELNTVDNVLRKVARDCSLVCIGQNQISRVIEDRRQNGFKGISFVFKRDNMRNRTVINILDHWQKESEKDQDQLILVDEIAKDITGMKSEDILPSTADELVDLWRESSENPRFSELPTSGMTYQQAKGIDPIFYFPGFRISKIKNLSSKLSNPSFIARYPSCIKSIDDLASNLSKEIIENFDQNMFTLICEGWSGPLVLKVASLLESKGKVAAILMIDAVPGKIKHWSKNIDPSESVLSRALPSLNQNDQISVDIMKHNKDKMSEIICKDETLMTSDEVMKVLDILINRLELLDNISDLSLRLLSKVHLISACDDPMETHLEVAEINQYCENACTYHVIENDLNGSILESKDLLLIIKHLVVLEYKSAVKQSIPAISTMELKDLR